MTNNGGSSPSSGTMETKTKIARIFIASENKIVKGFVKNNVNMRGSLEYIWGSPLTQQVRKADCFSLKCNDINTFCNKIIDNFIRLANGDEVLKTEYDCIPYYLGLKFKKKYYLVLKMDIFKYNLTKEIKFHKIKIEDISDINRTI